jgi:Uncharacterized protein conserved in bacteria
VRVQGPGVVLLRRRPAAARPDIAWSYPDPQHDAARVRDLIAFFDERIDVILDGERRARPVTPWSDGPGA